MASNVGLKGLRGTLEAALESDDISPLIKLVSSSTTARHTTEADDVGTAASPSASPAFNRRDEGLAIAEGTLHGVVQTLQGISERRDLELKRTCQANSSEISSAMKELSAVQATSADLRRRAQETLASMQRMGAHFSIRMDALDEALLVRDRIQHTRSALQMAMHIISLCDEAAESIETGQLYHSRRVLITLKKRYGPALKASVAAGDAEPAFPFEGLPATHLGSLSGKLLARINELDSKVDVRLTSCLNEWLTQARAVAGTVGRRALDLIDAEKLKSVELAETRKRQLDLQKASNLTNNNKNTEDAVAEDVKNKLLLSNNRAMAAIDSVSTDTQQKVLDGEDQDDDSVLTADPASIVDMTLLLRCVHVHSSENTLSQLLESYVEARQAQLGADLAPPGDLLICHRAFLWQIVGFFVIETRVGLVASQLETSAHTEASWEGASAALAAELGAAIDEASRPEDIRELKKQALLACDAIDKYCGDALSTRGIRSTLTSRVERVRATMASGVAAAVEEAVQSANATSSQINTPVDSISSDIASKMEALVTRLSIECREYMSGLVEEHALPAATCIEVDHVLAAAIATKVAAFIIKDGQNDAYLTASRTDSDDDDGSWNSEEEEAEDSGSDSDGDGFSGSGSGSSLYSDGDAESDGSSDSSGSSSASSDSGSQTEEEEDEEEEEDDGDEEEEEEEELFSELLHLVSIAAAAENALHTLRQRLLGQPSFSTTSTITNSTTKNLSTLERPSSSLLTSSSSPAPTTQLSGALMATEDAAGRRIAYTAYAAVDALADLDWTPESMPRTAGAISSQCAEILEVLEAGRNALEICGAPIVSQQRILGAAVRKIEEEIMRLLVSDAVPYINVFGAQRLLSDLQTLSKFVNSPHSSTSDAFSSTSSPSIARTASSVLASEWVSEPVFFGQVVAFNNAAELLDREKRSGKYACVNLDRFIVLLGKVQDPLGPPSAVGRGFLKAEDARRVAAELKNIVATERGSVS